mmetsp:Transcript_54718/g.63966  ORF Transcript_54718/g.63966 Transcript_54718/m.63966 type:complete len:90 (+) Transcript_54718:305-574(+)
MRGHNLVGNAVRHSQRDFLALPKNVERGHIPVAFGLEVVAVTHAHSNQKGLSTSLAIDLHHTALLQNATLSSRTGGSYFLQHSGRPHLY